MRPLRESPCMLCVHEFVCVCVCVIASSLVHGLLLLFFFVEPQPINYKHERIIQR